MQPLKSRRPFVLYSRSVFKKIQAAGLTKWGAGFALGSLTMLSGLLAFAPSARAQGTAFTYQGRLTVNGAPTNGIYDLRFTVYDSLLNGNVVAGPLTNSATAVSNGLFTAQMDFGSGVFTGSNRWLEIGAATNGGASFTIVGPRQALTPSPYAITAGGVPAGAITSSMLASGAVTSDKVAPGAIKAYQIDDGGDAAYQTFQSAAQAVGGDSNVPFADLLLTSPTNGISPSLSLSIGGAGFGTVVGFSGSEAISAPCFYVVQVQVTGAAVDPNSKLGLSGTLSYVRNGRNTTFSGLVTACTLSGASPSGLLYSVRLESSLAYMALSTNYRYYQLATVPNTVSSVCQLLTTNTPTLALAASYTSHENLIQYAETGLNFVSRLMEQEGIFYLLNFGSSPPGLVLGDSSSAYLTGPASAIPYYGDNATNAPSGVELLRKFQKAAHQSTLRSVVNTYNLTTPLANLGATNTGAAGIGEAYEFGTPVQTAAYDQATAQVRQQRQAVERALLAGGGNAPDLRAGYTFSVSDQTTAGLSGSYVVTAVHHAAFVRVTNSVSTLYYGNHIEAIPATLTFRPARTTHRPTALPCTAVVTGPAGETTHVDVYGRIKVQFHWDRYGANNDTSSGWMRVVTPIAGAQHGMLFLPHVGDEVLVSFLQGDPDRPVVTGSLYNAVGLPPYTLPANKNVSGIKSAATDSQVNELRFDDTAGSELLYLHGANDVGIFANHNLMLQAATGTVNLATMTVNGGTSFTNVQAGQVIAGSSTNSSLTVSITFPKAFITVPKIVATPHSDPAWSNVSDTFVASVRNASTTGCTINLVRVDSNAAWSQLLRVDWLAWE